MIIAIIGPTCSGKSILADYVANTINGLVVNFDAFQVYKEMNIGTAKPTSDEIKAKNYSLYNIVNVDDNFDVSKYQKVCREFLALHQKDNIVLVGGTGLYLKASLFDYHFEEEDPMPKNYLENIENNELYSRLFNIDEEDARKIGPNNRKRLLRALFIYETHNKTKSEINNNGKNTLLYPGVIFLGLDIPRETLYENINKRVENMFANGLEEEVNYLFKKYGKDNRSLQAIGYKEFNNDLSNLDRKELIKKNTRNYAKRQMTFFKHQFNGVKWFSSIEEAKNYVKDNLK